MVAFVGIAATAFLLTLQPVFAASNIIARQASVSNGTSVNGTSIPTSCKNLTSCVAVLNATATIQSQFCTATYVNNLEACLACAVNVTSGGLNQSDVDTLVSSIISECASDSMSISGISSTPPASTATGTAGAASTSASSDASNLSMSAFGIIFTSVLGAIALL